MKQNPGCCDVQGLHSAVQDHSRVQYCTLDLKVKEYFSRIVMRHFHSCTCTLYYTLTLCVWT